MLRKSKELGKSCLVSEITPVSLENKTNSEQNSHSKYSEVDGASQGRESHPRGELTVIHSIRSEGACRETMTCFSPASPICHLSADLIKHLPYSDPWRTRTVIWAMTSSHICLLPHKGTVFIFSRLEGSPF